METPRRPPTNLGLPAPLAGKLLSWAPPQQQQQHTDYRLSVPTQPSYCGRRLMNSRGTVRTPPGTCDVKPLAWFSVLVRRVEPAATRPCVCVLERRRKRPPAVARAPSPRSRLGAPAFPPNGLRSNVGTVLLRNSVLLFGVDGRAGARESYVKRAHPAQPSPHCVCVCACDSFFGRIVPIVASPIPLSSFFPSSFPLDRLTSTCSKICSIRLLPSGLCLRDLVRDKRERVCVPSSSSVWIYT